MKIIVPMAGRGTRLRPHTLTTPKPLLPIAGKPIVQRLCEDIVAICGNENVEEIAFVIGDFGEAVEKNLIEVAEKLGAKGSIYYQNKPLGTAHAILCAADSMDGELVIAFADTLFRADFKLDHDADGVIWVKQVEDPRAFGVVEIGSDGTINNFVEKPEQFVSDLAIIGIYHVKDGANLRSELQYLIDNDIKEKGEFQLTNALDNMKNKGLKFKPGKVDAWMDCGNKDVTIDTNSRVLDYLNGTPELRGKGIIIDNSEIIEPCYLGDGVVLRNVKIGPHVSLGSGTTVENASVRSSLLQDKCVIKNINLQYSMLGSHVVVNGEFTTLSLGDYSRMD